MEDAGPPIGAVEHMVHHSASRDPPRASHGKAE
jgi:hypothetical protein